MTSRRTVSSRPGKGRARPTSRSDATAKNGRAATRTTSRASPDPESGVDEAARARAKLTGRAAILALVIAVLAVSYASSARAWLRQRGEIEDLTAQIASSKQQIRALEQEKRRWNDPAYIRDQAGARFGWVMPGEVGYRVIGDDGRTLDDDGGALADPTPASTADPAEWWDEVWGSVEIAGGVDDEESAPEREPVTRIGQHGQAPSKSR